MNNTYHNHKNRFVSLVGVSVEDIPESLEFEGEKFAVKPEFHITLLAVKHLAEIIDRDNAEKIQHEIVNEFYQFTEKFSLIEYEVQNDIRLVTTGNNKSIIVIVKLKDIEKLFEKLEKKYQTALPLQPTHITLYTLPASTYGIPIFSNKELQGISQPIHIPWLESLIKTN